MQPVSKEFERAVTTSRLVIVNDDGRGHNTRVYRDGEEISSSISRIEIDIDCRDKPHVKIIPARPDVEPTLVFALDTLDIVAAGFLQDKIEGTPT